MDQTTPSARHVETQFQLIAKQLQTGTNVADLGSASQTPHYQAACHLLGIAAYVSELAKEIKSGLEARKI